MCYPVLFREIDHAARGLSAGPSQGSFWDGAVFLAVTGVNVGLLVYVKIRDRRRALVAGHQAGTAESTAHIRGAARGLSERPIAAG